MDLDRVLGQRQLAADELVGQTAQDQAQHIGLPWCQAEALDAVGVRRGGRTGQTGGQVERAAGHGGQCAHQGATIG